MSDEPAEAATGGPKGDGKGGTSRPEKRRTRAARGRAQPDSGGGGGGGKVFDGVVFALTNGSGGKLNWTAATELITNNGGKVSSIVHKRVGFLVCDEQAVRQNTQRVRKAAKFGVPLVTVSFLSECVERAEVLDPRAYAPSPSAR